LFSQVIALTPHHSPRRSSHLAGFGRTVLITGTPTARRALQRGPSVRACGTYWAVRRRCL